MDVLLSTGHKFVLSEEVKVTVETRTLPSGESRVEMILGDGTIRVVTADTPGALIVTRTATGQARSKVAEFIVSCGPPAMRSTDICMFVGVHGRTVVESLAFPGQPTTLESQFFTKVQKNQLPDPPQLMPNAQYQNLLMATTVIGTGAEQDRIGMTDPGAAGDEVFQVERLLAPGQSAPPQRTFSPETIIDQQLPQYYPDKGGTPPGISPPPETPLPETPLPESPPGQ